MRATSHAISCKSEVRKCYGDTYYGFSGTGAVHLLINPMAEKGKRILILGTGVLNGFRANPFRAVLAHEYGHFAHRDTAGGDAAFRVNNDMMKFATAMVYSGQAVWWNVGFQFVRLYHFLFRRISFGASRLQEVLADRKAAALYGSAAFEEGLRPVVRRSVEFNHLANQEIGLASATGGNVHNSYDLSLEEESSEEKSSIDSEVEKSLNRKSSEDDTHPSPAERFRFIRGIAHSSANFEESSLVWDLFVNRPAITTEMTSWIDQAIPRKTEKPAGSSETAAFTCDNCGAQWNPSEYRSDATQIFCSSCKQELVLPGK